MIRFPLVYKFSSFLGLVIPLSLFLSLSPGTLLFIGLFPWQSHVCPQCISLFIPRTIACPVLLPFTLILFFPFLLRRHFCFVLQTYWGFCYGFWFYSLYIRLIAPTSDDLLSLIRTPGMSTSEEDISSSQLPGKRRGSWGPTPFVKGRWQAPSCPGLVQVTTDSVFSWGSCPSYGHVFLTSTPPTLQLLHSFCPLSCNVPWDLEKVIQMPHLELSTHSQIFSALWPVTNLCGGCCPPQNKTSLTRSESSPNT